MFKKKINKKYSLYPSVDSRFFNEFITSTFQMSDIHNQRDIIPPESWVMRRPICSYCDYMPNSFDDPCMKEEMIYGQAWGWVYCISCYEIHRKNVDRYCFENGYYKAHDVFNYVPSLKKLSEASRLCVLAKDSPIDRLYTSNGWKVYTSRSQICTRINENKKMCLHLENSARNLAVWVEMENLLRLNGIYLFEIHGIRNHKLSKCIESKLNNMNVIKTILQYGLLAIHPSMPVEVQST